MSEEIKNTAAAEQTAEQDYRTNFMPSVHRIGRFTMIIALVLTALPFVYYYFIKGYKAPIAMFGTGLASVVAMFLGGWLTEPLTYWPVLGSAGTYMSYLSGNVSGMRFPVASAVQKSADADINTPKGQVATIVGLVASIVVNIVVLLITVLLGDAIIAALPDRVLHAFGYCAMCIMASLLLMRLTMGKEKFTKNAMNVAPYIICGVAAYFLANKLVPSLATYGTALGVIASIVVSYIRYKKDRKNWENTQSEGAN